MGLGACLCNIMMCIAYRTYCIPHYLGPAYVPRPRHIFIREVDPSVPCTAGL